MCLQNFQRGVAEILEICLGWRVNGVSGRLLFYHPLPDRLSEPPLVQHQPRVRRGVPQPAHLQKHFWSRKICRHKTKENKSPPLPLCVRLSKTKNLFSLSIIPSHKQPIPPIFFSKKIYWPQDKIFFKKKEKKKGKKNLWKFCNHFFLGFVQSVGTLCR